MNDAFHRLVLIAIAAITVVSGLTQMVAPGFVLSMIGGDTTPAVTHTFATVGMFMVITGAMFLQTLWRRSKESAVPLWIGVQKFAAAGFVGWGVLKSVFGALALGVAVFDLLSAILIWVYLARGQQ